MNALYIIPNDVLGVSETLLLLLLLVVLPNFHLQVVETEILHILFVYDLLLLLVLLERGVEREGLVVALVLLEERLFPEQQLHVQFVGLPFGVDREVEALLREGLVGWVQAESQGGRVELELGTPLFGKLVAEREQQQGLHPPPP